MINPDKKDIGRNVTYKKDGCKKEFGVITSFNKSGVFVRYGSDNHSKHTRREDLFFDRD